MLRPLSVGDMIDRILRLIRANLVLFAGISIIPALIIQVMQRASGLSQTIDPNNFSLLLDPRTAATATRAFTPVDPIAFLLVGVASAFVSMLVYGAVTAAVGERYLGHPIGIAQAFQRGLRAIPAALGAAILCFLVVTVAFVLIFVAVAVINVAALSVLAGLIAFVAFVFLLPWAFLSLAVLGPVIVIERLGPIRAIRRSFQLMDKARLRTLGLYVLVVIIAGILGQIFSVIFLASFVTEPTARAVLQTAAAVASSAISGPLVYGAFVLLYYDLRVRKEAFDLQLAAEALPREA